MVDAELVNDDHLPAIVAPAPNARPTVDRHTILYPGQNLPTEADQPTYTKRNLYVCERTKERLENQSAPKNTSANYRSQRNQLGVALLQGPRELRCPRTEHVPRVRIRGALPSTWCASRASRWPISRRARGRGSWEARS